MSGSTTPRRRRHDPLAAKFATDTERHAYFAEMGRISNAKRVILSGDEVAALASAYQLLADIAARHPHKLTTTDEQQTDPTDEAAEPAV